MNFYGHNNLREKFLSFFEKNRHKRIKSSSLIPAGDKTLLFTNAGMNQFKDYFLGIKEPPYSNAVSSQKCLRAGGKHNDLENVGYTSRHHTFFEMLGNFSFGDYFKESAIELAWDFVLNHLKISKDKLFVSVYKDDDEAFQIWNKNIGLNQDRIFTFGEKENFWAMGDTGPCGPCSEIFYDLGDSYGELSQDNEDRFLEIWNLVFMEHERSSDGNLKPLKKKNIDTGMGLERTLSVLENVQSNFDTSLFMPIIQKIEDLFDIKYLQDDSIKCTAFRVIADHCRAIAFLIADGQVPTNFSRGYVLRRIIRRAYRYGMTLGAKNPFLYRIIEIVIKTMSEAYPDLQECKKHIADLVLREENSFNLTLGKGIGLVNELIMNLKRDKIEKIKGEEAFKLYDTYGIPIDIISDMAKDHNMSFDHKDFLRSMERQKENTRQNSQFKINNEAFRILEEQKISSEFIGHDIDHSYKTKIKAIFQAEDLKDTIEKGKAYIITEKTPFYPEKGGQVGDKGKLILSYTDEEVNIIDTVYLTDNCIGHLVDTKFKISTGDDIILKIDENNRKDIEKNHTGTHLLHYALREVLGDFVKQSGSLVEANRLRFDFTHHKPLTDKQIEDIERLIFNIIIQCHEVSKEQMNYEKALESGAIAIFAEKYDDIVRVVRIGDFSIELCGGTHLKNTGEIGILKIIHESAIASGIRRIEAITGNYAFLKFQEIFGTEKIIKGKFIKGKTGIIDYVSELNDNNRAKDKELEAIKLKLLNHEVNRLITERAKFKDINIIKYKTAEKNIKILKTLIDNIKQKTSNTIIFIISELQSPVVLCAVTKDLVSRFDANKILKELLSSVSGRGGGRADLAQGGFKDINHTNKVFGSIEDIIKRFYL